MTQIPQTLLNARRKAQRQQCKSSIMLEGLPGRGKSGLALAIAHILADKDWSLIDAVDTENESLDLFVGLKNIDGSTIGQFNVSPLTAEIGYRPSYYLALRKQAIDAGAKVWIGDSISHAWQYKGGLLDMVNDAKGRLPGRQKDDPYAAWNDDGVRSEKMELLELVRTHKCHVITTVRVKEKQEYSTDDAGRTILKSLGAQQIQQPDLKYEPDLVIQMLKAGNTSGKEIVYPIGIIQKSRYAIFQENQEYTFTPKLLEELKEYLDSGVDPEILLEKRRQDYITGIKDTCKANSAKHAAWKMIKTDAGFDKVKLEDMALEDIVSLHSLWVS